MTSPTPTQGEAWTAAHRQRTAAQDKTGRIGAQRWSKIPPLEALRLIDQHTAMFAALLEARRGLEVARAILDRLGLPCTEADDALSTIASAISQARTGGE